VHRTLITMAVAALLAGAASPALASGGKAGGGGTATGGAATGGGGGGAAPGGGGGGGSAAATGGGATGGGGGGGGANSGGVNGGGANDPTPAPAPAPVIVPTPSGPPSPPCATFQSATAPVGYYSIYAALWNDYTIRDCADHAEDVDVEVIDADCESGRVDYDVTYLNPLSANQNLSMVLDNDFAPFNTSYCITYTATEVLTGAQLDRTSLTAATPAPQ
jgi:hypothetical protein